MNGRQILTRVLSTAAVIAMLGTGLAAQERTETVDRTVPLPSNGTVELKTFSGNVRITGTSGRDVVIHAVRRARQEQLDTIKLTIETSGSRIVINANERQPGRRSNNDNVVRTDFEIQVPASAGIDVDGFSSDITVTGLTGSQRLEAFSGSITVRGARGTIRAEVFSGEIDIDASADRNVPEISAESFSGSIRLKLAEQAAGTVNFDSFSGTFDTDLAMTIRTVRRSRTEGDLPGGAGRPIRLHTFSGNVKIER